MKKNNTKNYFVFDFDDTLVDGREFCGETIARAITQLHPEANFELIVKIHESIRGMAIRDLYEYILKELNLELSIDELLKLDVDIQIKNIRKMRIFDGAKEILEFLKTREKKIYICTNRSKKLLMPILEHNEISEYFDEVISCVDEGYKKPNPKCLLDIITREKTDKDEFIYFGDSEIDSQFAKNAGIEFIIFDQYLNNKNLFKKLINLFLEEKMNNSLLLRNE